MKSIINNNVILPLLRILLVVFICAGPLESAYAQDRLLSVKIENETLKDALKQIEKASDYVFLYQEGKGTIDLNRKVTVIADRWPIAEILDVIFRDTGVVYEIKARQISLRQGPVPSKAQEKKSAGKKRTLTGTVTDAVTNEPLIGAGVMLKGSNDGTITDVDGNYSIEVADNSEIIVSFLGMVSQTLAVGDLGVLNVALRPDDNTLSEVVVVGAGTQTKVSVTGSISAIKGTQLRTASSSLTSGLAGKLAGVFSSTTSGEPGAVSEFYIRGVGTFGGRATPLILLDDIEISSADLNRLPAESIESFSILKDASATAIYGARGANGVMLITTKKGTENTRAKINVSVESSFLQPVNRVEYVDGPTWMETYNEALLARNPSASVRFSQETIDNTRNGINPYVYPDVDWYSLMFKKMTYNQRANVNLTGGGSKVTYYMGLQVNHDSGILNVPKAYSFDANINDWNYIFQNNISYKPTKTTTVDLHINAQFGNRRAPGSDLTEIFDNVYNSNPVSFPAFYPVSEGDEHIKFGNSIKTADRLNVNPYAHMMRSYKESNYATINASLRAVQKLDFITEGLNVSALVNMKSYAYSDYVNTIEPYYYRVMDYTYDPSDPGFFKLESLRKGTDHIAQGGISRYSDFTFYFDARINYNRSFNSRHHVSGMLMYMMREYRNDVLPNRNQGFSGRFTYDFDHRYLAEVNFGYNGTERLAKGQRFELFPAISLGWVVSNEPWWSKLTPYVNNLKIRGSYGLVGSDETGLLAGAAHFLYRNEVVLNGGGSFTTGSYNGSRDQIAMTGPAFLKYAVANAGWERAKKLDVGLDVTLFNQLDITLDYFYDRRDRILQKRSSWPAMLGYSSTTPWANVGKVDNQGVELSVNWRKNFREDLSVDLRGNFACTKNKYVYIDEPDYPYVWQTQTGKSLSATYGYIADGLFRDDKDIMNSPSQTSLGGNPMPGDIKYRDVNGDGMITEDDKVMISEYGRQPGIQFGLGFNLVWRGFDFGVFFNGSARRTLMIDGISSFSADDFHQDRNLMKFIADDYYHADRNNLDAAYPRLGTTPTEVQNNMVPSTFWMRNGSFIRFKTLELGYSFPFVRIYFSGDNLAVWSPFKYWDPELFYYSYPLHRTFSLGLQFTF